MRAEVDDQALLVAIAQREIAERRRELDDDLHAELEAGWQPLEADPSAAAERPAAQARRSGAPGDPAEVARAPGSERDTLEERTGSGAGTPPGSGAFSAATALARAVAVSGPDFEPLESALLEGEDAVVTLADIESIEDDVDPSEPVSGT